MKRGISLHSFLQANIFGKHAHLIRSDDIVQPVGNGEGRALREKALDDFQHVRLGLGVHGSRCLIQAQDRDLLQSSTGQAHELLLADRPSIAACAINLPIQTSRFCDLKGCGLEEVR